MSHLMVTGTFVVRVNKHETVLVQRHRIFSTMERLVFVDSYVINFFVPYRNSKLCLLPSYARLSFMDFEVLPEEGVQGEVVV